MCKKLKVFLSGLFSLLLFFVAPTANATSINLDSLKNIVSRAPSDTAKVKILLAAVSALRCADTIDRRLLAEEVLNLCEKVNWDRGAEHSCRVLAEIESKCRGNAARATKYYSLQISYLRKFGDKSATILAYREFCNYLLGVADYKGADYYYQQAINLHLSPDVDVEFLMGIGGIFDLLGGPANALVSYNQALEALDTAHDKGIIETPYYRLLKGRLKCLCAKDFLLLGQIPKALEAYKTSLELGRTVNSEPLILRANMGLAELYDRQKDYGKAIKYYVAALKASKETSNRREGASILDKLSGVYFKNKEFGRSGEYAMSLLNVANDLKNKALIINAYISFSRLSTREGRYKEADSCLKNGLQLDARDSAASELEELYLALCNNYQLWGKIDSAYWAFRQFEGIKDSLALQARYNDVLGVQLMSQYTMRQYADSLRTITASRVDWERKVVFTYGAASFVVMFVFLLIFMLRMHKMRKIVQHFKRQLP